MTALNRPHLHEPELTPDPPPDWRDAMLAACGTVLALAAVVGVYELVALIVGRG